MFQKKLWAIALITSQSLLATTSFASPRYNVLEEYDVFEDQDQMRMNSLSERCHFPKDKASWQALSVEKFNDLCSQLAGMANTCLDTQSGSFKIIKQLQTIGSELKKFDIMSEMDAVRDEAADSIIKALGHSSSILDTCVRLTETIQDLSLLIQYQLKNLEASETYKAECLTPRPDLATTEYHSWMTMENALAAVAVSLLAVAGVLTYRYRKIHGGASRSATLAFTGTQTVSVETNSRGMQAAAQTIEQGMQAVTQTAEQGAQTVADAINAVVDSAVGNSRPNTPVSAAQSMINSAVGNSRPNTPVNAAQSMMDSATPLTAATSMVDSARSRPSTPLTAALNDSGYDDGGFEDRPRTSSVSGYSDGPVGASTPVHYAAPSADVHDAGTQTETVLQNAVETTLKAARRLSATTRDIIVGALDTVLGAPHADGTMTLRERTKNGKAVTAKVLKKAKKAVINEDPGIFSGPDSDSDD